MTYARTPRANIDARAADARRRGIITNQALKDLCRTLRAWDDDYHLTAAEIAEIAGLLAEEYEAIRNDA